MMWGKRFIHVIYLDEIRIFTELIRTELCKYRLPSYVAKEITPQMRKVLYDISIKHDLSHIVAIALKRNGLLSNDGASYGFRKGIQLALLRHEAMQYELNQVCEVFEQERIIHIPLKGSVICNSYPEPWMRTCSDIDILVKKEDLERAKNLIIDKLGYKVLKRNYHDISMLSPGKTLLELHFRIEENVDGMDKLLRAVWNYARPIEEGRCRYVMTSEYLIFHAMAHMLYHFINGGCGVRFLIDLWLLEHNTNYDSEKLDGFYRDCGMLRFVNGVRNLTKVWFAGKKHDEMTLRMQKYIVEGGLFGSVENKVMVRKTQINGKIIYLLKRVFPSYDELKLANSEADMKPYKYPYYMIKRWLKLFNHNEAKLIHREFKANMEMNLHSVNELKQLFEYLNI